MTLVSLPVLLGLLAALTWGAADFAGGLATRREAPSLVVLVAHGLSLFLLLALSLTAPATLPFWAVLGGVFSGVAGALALMLFYKALSAGAMGLSAALAGLLTAILPVLLAVRLQGAPPPMQRAGFAVAALAILLIAYAPPVAHQHTSRQSLVLATFAGVGFGLQLVWLHSAAAAGSAATPAITPSAAQHTWAAHLRTLSPVLRALLLSRAGGTAVALCTVVLTRARLGRGAGSLPPPSLPHTDPSGNRLCFFLLAASAGLLDTGGNGLYMLSSLGGRLDIAAVLSSLYPGATIALAALFLKERATALQALGMGCALLAVGLIAS